MGVSERAGWPTVRLARPFEIDESLSRPGSFFTTGVDECPLLPIGSVETVSMLRTQLIGHRPVSEHHQWSTETMRWEDSCLDTKCNVCGSADGFLSIASSHSYLARHDRDIHAAESNKWGFSEKEKKEKSDGKDDKTRRHWGQVGWIRGLVWESSANPSPGFAFSLVDSRNNAASTSATRLNQANCLSEQEPQNRHQGNLENQRTHQFRSPRILVTLAENLRPDLCPWSATAPCWLPVCRRSTHLDPVSMFNSMTRYTTTWNCSAVKLHVRPRSTRT